MKLDALLSSEADESPLLLTEDQTLFHLLMHTPSMREQFERGTPLSADEIMELNRPS